MCYGVEECFWKEIVNRCHIHIHTGFEYMFIESFSICTCVGKCKCIYQKNIYITIYVCVIHIS